MRELAISEVFDLAADLIEVRGWNGLGPGGEYKFGMDPWGGGSRTMEPVCVEGALAAVLGIEIEPDMDIKVGVMKVRTCPAYAAMQEYLNIRTELWMWNDTGRRSKSEVIEALRGAAAVQRIKEESPSHYLQEVTV